MAGRSWPKGAAPLLGAGAVSAPTTAQSLTSHLGHYRERAFPRSARGSPTRGLSGARHRRVGDPACARAAASCRPRLPEGRWRAENHRPVGGPLATTTPGGRRKTAPLGRVCEPSNTSRHGGRRSTACSHGSPPRQPLRHETRLPALCRTTHEHPRTPVGQCRAGFALTRPAVAVNRGG